VKIASFIEMVVAAASVVYSPLSRLWCCVADSTGLVILVPQLRTRRVTVSCWGVMGMGPMNNAYSAVDKIAHLVDEFQSHGHDESCLDDTVYRQEVVDDLLSAVTDIISHVPDIGSDEVNCSILSLVRAAKTHCDVVREHDASSAMLESATNLEEITIEFLDIVEEYDRPMEAENE